MKKLLLSFWLLALLAVMSFVLWHEDWKYSLPTPVPEKYDPAKPVDGSYLRSRLSLPGDKPFFIHFFNPECPCSRFNIPHIKSLVHKYGDKINFVIVVPSADTKYDVAYIRKKFDLEIPVYFDKLIADSCGVYSTPQAVIIKNSGELYYRGNYNKSRFCADKNTNYAQMAVDSLLHDSENLITDKAALKSYGCCLPKCTKTN
jgi:hypothetical protein